MYNNQVIYSYAGYVIYTAYLIYSPLHTKYSATPHHNHHHQHHSYILHIICTCSIYTTLKYIHLPVGIHIKPMINNRIIWYARSMYRACIMYILLYIIYKAYYHSLILSCDYTAATTTHIQ